MNRRFRQARYCLWMVAAIVLASVGSIQAVTMSDRLVIANKMLCLPPFGLNPIGTYWWTVPCRPWDSGFVNRPSAWCTNLSAPNMMVQGYIEEINQAKAYGIDAFVVDLTSFGQTEIDMFKATVTAAETVGDFYVCAQPDLVCGANPQNVKPFLDATISSPAYLKIDGLPAVIPYCAGYDIPANEKAAWTDWYASQGMPIAYIPSCFNDLGWYTGNDYSRRDPVTGYPTFAKAITSFTPLDVTGNLRASALAYWQDSLPFMADITLQYQNRVSNYYLDNHLTQVFRDAFKWCIDNRDNGVAWVQPLCWNDFGESAFAPSTTLFMSLAPIHKYYADWFKSGVQPTVETDSVSVFHRVYPSGTTPSQYSIAGPCYVADEVEAVALLSAPATLYLQSGSNTYSVNVGAGVQSLRKPFSLGIQKAWVVRSGATTATVTSLIPIHNDPIISNIWVNGYGSAYPPESVSLSNWSTLSGTMSGNGSSANGIGVALVGEPTTLFDYRVSATITPGAGGNDATAGLIVCAQSNSYFSFTIGRWNTVAGWRLNRVDNGVETVLKYGSTTFVGGQSRVIRLDRVGGYLVAYIDGVNVACTSDWGTPGTPYTDSRWGYGKGGVLTTGASATFTNIAMERFQPNMSNIVKTPTFSVAPGRYSGSQTIAISSATSGATIRYTTNGSTPTNTTGTVYSGAVPISSTATLKAIAYKTGMLTSYVRSGEYLISSATQAAAPQVGLATGTYSGPQRVTISTSTSGATVRYTTDGSTPTPLHGKIGTSVLIYKSCTLKAIAYRQHLTDSPVSTATYTINPTTGWIQIDPPDTTSYATPDAVINAPAFSEVHPMPAPLAVTNGVLPSMKVTYSLTVAGVSGWGIQTSGRQGLMLFAGASPDANDGLFTGVDEYAYTYFGALANGIAQPPQPMTQIFFSYAPASTVFDVAVELSGGVVTTTVKTIVPLGIPEHTQAYIPSASDIAAWTGQTGFAAFRAGLGVNYAYSRSVVSNIKFYGLTTLISAAKQLGDGTLAGVDDGVVSAAFTDHFYIQSQDRSCGIRVDKPEHGLSEGMLADVSGMLTTNSDGERCISASTAVRNGSDTVEVRPLFVTNFQVASGDYNYDPATGAGQIGLPGLRGLNNVGLLVRTTGRVAYADPSGAFAYIDDGSGALDQNTLGEGGAAVRGVRVILPSGVNWPPGTHVAVTGASSLATVNGSPARAVRVRFQDDISVLL